MHLALVIALLGPADRFADVEVVPTPIRGAVHMLTGAGGNIGASVGDDGVLLVDDQFAPLSERIREALPAGKRQVDYVLNTHFHGDHTGGNPNFGREAVIVAHRNVRERLATDQQSMFGKTQAALPPHGLPVITYRDGISLHFNGEEIRVWHLPAGHTDGDSVVHFTKANVFHVGDHFFNGAFPFVDIAHGGTVEGYRDNVRQLLEKIPGDAKIIPGHGPLATREDYVAFHQMLAETIELVAAMKKAGKSLDEAKETGLPAKYDRWSGGLVKEPFWIELVYKSLSP